MTVAAVAVTPAIASKKASAVERRRLQNARGRAENAAAASQASPASRNDWRISNSLSPPPVASTELTPTNKVNPAHTANVDASRP